MNTTINVEGVSLPKGYRVVWLQSVTACYWANDKGESGKTYRWKDSAKYVSECREDARRHAAGRA